jgi:hypothetical protein
VSLGGDRRVLLVEDDEAGSEKKGFVMITADFNVRLIHCSKGKGQEDFNAFFGL